MMSGPTSRISRPERCLAAPGHPSARERSAFPEVERNIEKELSSATHVAETADGGWKPPRLVASPAAAALCPRRWVSQTVRQPIGFLLKEVLSI